MRSAPEIKRPRKTTRYVNRREAEKITPPEKLYTHSLAAVHESETPGVNGFTVYSSTEK